LEHCSRQIILIGEVVAEGLLTVYCPVSIYLVNRQRDVMQEVIMKILMYYDGTEQTKEALPLVKLHGKAFNARVDVVSSLAKGGEHQLKTIEERERELEYIKGVLEKDKIPCQTHLLIRGHDPGEDIVLFAKENNVDEIIIGTEKKTRVEKFILGSVAQHVVINAKCPVLIV
jgi:nucleotide-binding universal stress UspA family protein